MILICRDCSTFKFFITSFGKFESHEKKVKADMPFIEKLRLAKRASRNIAGLHRLPLFCFVLFF